MDNANAVFYRLACPVVFVGTAHQGLRDIMTATAMFVSEKEPLVTISVARGHLTDRLIEQSGEFALGLAAEGQEDLAIQMGSTKGDGTDKLERFGVKVLDLTGTDAPVPDGVASWMRCRVEIDHRITGYRVITGRVVDSADFDRNPLIWQKDRFFPLKPS